MERFVILESKITGQRTINPVVGGVVYEDNDEHEVCAFGPTRQSCVAVLFMMKPSKYKLVVKDVYDNIISEGRRVAYNYQGEVRIGYVVGVTNTKRNGKLVNTWTKEPYLVISVRQPNGSVSKVANRKNLVVID